MSEKKRTIVTTIETHELWIIRKALPEPAAPILLPTEKPQLPAASRLRELNNSPETNEESEL
jgi:hypothetical protein